MNIPEIYVKMLIIHLRYPPPKKKIKNPNSYITYMWNRLLNRNVYV